MFCQHEWKYIGSKNYISLPPEQFSYKTVYVGDKIYSVYQDKICVFLIKDTEVLYKPDEKFTVDTKTVEFVYESPL